MTITLRCRNLTESLEADLQKATLFSMKTFFRNDYGDDALSPTLVKAFYFFLFVLGSEQLWYRKASLALFLSLSSVTQMIAPLVESQWVHYSMLSIVLAYSSLGINLELDDRQ